MTFQSERPSLYWDLKWFFHGAKTVLAWPGLKTPPADRKELTREAWCALTNVEGTSLVVQWLRICLPIQGTQVWSLAQEDLICCRATKPTSHSYGKPIWSRTPTGHTCHNYWAVCLEPRLRNSQASATRSPHTTTKGSPHSPLLGKRPWEAMKTQHRQK